MQPEENTKRITQDSLTDNEIRIINDLRNLQPYGKLEITADPNGKYDTYLVHSSRKVVLK